MGDKETKNSREYLENLINRDKHQHKKILRGREQCQHPACPFKPIPGSCVNVLLECTFGCHLRYHHDPKVDCWVQLRQSTQTIEANGPCVTQGCAGQLMRVVECIGFTESRDLVEENAIDEEVQQEDTGDVMMTQISRKENQITYKFESLEDLEVTISRTESPPQGKDLYIMNFTTEISRIASHYRQQRWTARSIANRWDWITRTKRDCYNAHAEILQREWTKFFGEKKSKQESEPKKKKSKKKKNSDTTGTKKSKGSVEPEDGAPPPVPKHKLLKDDISLRIANGEFTSPKSKIEEREAKAKAKSRRNKEKRRKARKRKARQQEKLLQSQPETPTETPQSFGDLSPTSSTQPSPLILSKIESIKPPELPSSSPPNNEEEDTKCPVDEIESITSPGDQPPPSLTLSSMSTSPVLSPTSGAPITPVESPVSTPVLVSSTKKAFISYASICNKNTGGGQNGGKPGALSGGALRPKAAEEIEDTKQNGEKPSVNDGNVSETSSIKTPQQKETTDSSPQTTDTAEGDSQHEKSQQNMGQGEQDTDTISGCKSEPLPKQLEKAAPKGESIEGGNNGIGLHVHSVPNSMASVSGLSSVLGGGGVDGTCRSVKAAHTDEDAGTARSLSGRSDAVPPIPGGDDHVDDGSGYHSLGPYRVWDPYDISREDMEIMLMNIGKFNADVFECIPLSVTPTAHLLLLIDRTRREFNPNNGVSEFMSILKSRCKFSNWRWIIECANGDRSSIRSSFMFEFRFVEAAAHAYALMVNDGFGVGYVSAEFGEAYFSRGSNITVVPSYSPKLSDGFEFHKPVDRRFDGSLSFGVGSLRQGDIVRVRNSLQTDYLIVARTETEGFMLVTPVAKFKRVKISDILSVHGSIYSMSQEERDDMLSLRQVTLYNMLTA